MLTFYAISYSPWSEKARWALDYCRTEYRERPYQSMLGELPMRLRTGRWTQRISLPIAMVHGEVLTDSYQIAEFAARSRLSLMPAPELPEIRRWNAASDRLLAAGRRRTTRSVCTDPTALKEALATSVPGGHLLPLAVGKLSAGWLLRKYASEVDSDDDDRSMREGLLQLRAALETRDRLLSSFTYADVTMAVALQFIRPPASIAHHIAPGVLPHWTSAELAEEFGDLLVWRDAVYATHRHP